MTPSSATNPACEDLFTDRFLLKEESLKSFTSVTTKNPTSLKTIAMVACATLAALAFTGSMFYLSLPSPFQSEAIRLIACSVAGTSGSILAIGLLAHIAHCAIFSAKKQKKEKKQEDLEKLLVENGARGLASAVHIIDCKGKVPASLK